MTALSTLPFREELGAIAPFDHGPGRDEARAASGREDVLDLAGNENAVGPSPKVAEAMKAGASEGWSYPDSRYPLLGDMVARDLAVAPERLLFGTGSEALLALIARATLQVGDRVVLSSPTFPIYGTLASSLGATIVDVPRRADFTLDVDAVIAAFDEPVRLLFLCNPNNPTGTPVSLEDMAAIASHVQPDAMIIVDEAYHEFAWPRASTGTLAALDGTPAAYCVLRTFSKAFAIGGFRVGYVIARDAGMIDYLDRVRPQFGVSRLGQLAAAAAWQDVGHLDAAVSEICDARERLRDAIGELGYHVWPSSANFLLVDDPDGGLLDRLLKQGLIVRRVPPAYIRVTVCGSGNIERVIEGFRRARTLSPGIDGT